ncbi:hypothetical protein MMC13_006213 [Lambiella insularis]|nr:hypothetical protein [Lambiella insularis]
MPDSANTSGSAASRTCGPADGHSPFACTRFAKEDCVSCLKYCWALSPNGIALVYHAIQPDPDAKELGQFLISHIQISEDLERRVGEFILDGRLIDQGRKVPKALWDEYTAKVRLAYEYDHAMHALQAAGVGPWVRPASGSA